MEMIVNGFLIGIGIVGSVLFLSIFGPLVGVLFNSTPGKWAVGIITAVSALYFFSQF